MLKYQVATTPNGKDIYAYLMQPPLGANVSRNPHLLTLVKEVVRNLEVTLPSVTVEKDMGRNIGYCDLVETDDSDVVFYARLLKTASYTRFVKNKKSSQTSFLSFVLQVDEDGEYELKNAWIGKLYPPIPSEENTTKKSANYWENHALVFNGQPLVASSITKDCPY